MGVRVIDNDDAYDGDACSACGATKPHLPPQHAPPASAYSTFHESKTEPLGANYQHNFAGGSLMTKDLIGNSKEFRIVHNKCDLRIIGNGNRIRMDRNSGSVQIIGNATRMKINNNAGHIKYTGNDGRICLGSDSTQQLVDYIGCNGILKVVNAMELNVTRRDKCKSKNNNTAASSKAADKGEGDEAFAPKMKGKSASFGGVAECSSTHWQQFGELFQRKNWQRIASMPNLKDNIHVSNNSNCNKNKCSFKENTCSSKCNCKCKCKCCKNKNKTNTHNCSGNSNVKVVNNIGSIVIKNAVNISLV